MLMSLAEAKQTLRQGYAQAGFEILDENQHGEIVLRHPHARMRDVLLKITVEDMEEYAVFSQLRANYDNAPTATSLCSATYREHLLTSLDATVQEYELRDFVFRGRHDDSPVVEIDVVSEIFTNYFRFTPGFLQLCLDRLYLMPDFKRRESQQNPIDIRDILARPLSIRVTNLQSSSVQRAVEDSNALIEGAIFTLAYEWGLPVWLQDDWSASRMERLEERQSRMDARRTGEGEIYIPDARFNTDMLKLYQAGLSSPIPSQRFLAYYQILALTFQDVVNEILYERLGRIVNDPRFKTNAIYLRRIVTEVEDYKGELDEVQMLEMTLGRYVGEEALNRYIDTLEEDNQEGIYTARRMVFGNSIPGAKGEEQSLNIVARRLVAVKEAILHIGMSQHIPLSQTTENVERELPMVQFLAQQIIIATASP
jgi:hypothetical protein